MTVADLFFPGLPQDRVGLDADALHGIDNDHGAVAQPNRRRHLSVARIRFKEETSVLTLTHGTTHSCCRLAATDALQHADCLHMLCICTAALATSAPAT